MDGYEKEGKISRFGAYEFVRFIRLVQNMEFEKLTPIEIMNLAWLKRRAKIAEGADQTAEELHREKKDDMGIFISMVDICYNYYKKMVFPETKRYLHEGT